jgi:hypothetical protein
MTNQQRAAFETAKFFLAVIIISATIGLAVISGWGAWVGIVACTAMAVYGAIMIYEIKLGQIEAEQQFKEKI